MELRSALDVLWALLYFYLEIQLETKKAQHVHCKSNYISGTLMKPTPPPRVNLRGGEWSCNEWCVFPGKVPHPSSKERESAPPPLY